MGRVKVGVIGAGFIGPAHIESMRRLGFVDVVALATSSEDTAKHKAKALSIPRAYGNWQDLMEGDEVEVVQITSPNYLHFSQAKAALEAGKHVVCDKPLTIHSKESKILLRLATKKGLVNAVTFNHRFYPLVQEARALMRENKLGSVRIVQGGYHQDWLAYQTDYNWRVEAEKGGPTRVVGDIGIHWLDAIQFVTGLRIESVFADFSTFIPFRKSSKERTAKPFNKNELIEYEDVPINTEDFAIVLLRFLASKARGVMTVSQVSIGRKCRLFFEIFGSESSVAWDSEIANQLWIGRRDEANELLIKDPNLLAPTARRFTGYPGGHGEGFPDTLTQCNRTIYEYIRDRRYERCIEPDFPTFEDGYRAQILQQSIIRSAREDTWVKLSAADS